MQDKGTTLKIAINDANLFIDLIEINLLESFFELPLFFHTTNLVLNELDIAQGEQIKLFVLKGKLKIRDLDREEIESLGLLAVQSRKLSIADLSLYFHAKELNYCMILTGDNKLKKEAQKQGFEVHGILWVFEKLVENKLIINDIAVEKLQELMRINMWLPLAECEKLLDKLSQIM